LLYYLTFRNQNKKFLIADSGASVHLTGSIEGMTNLKELKNDRVTVGDGTSILAENIGNKNITILQEDGEEWDVVLRGCKYVPKLGPFSLFSLTNSVDKGFKLGNEGKNITIRKGDLKLKFDRIINTKSGYVCGVATKTKKNYDVVNSTLEKSSSVDVNHFHQLLGHLGQVKTREIAKYYGIKLTCKYKPCLDCVKGKAKQANVPKGIPDIALYSDTMGCVNGKSKILKLHILDRLDFLNDEKMEMKEDIRSGLLRECVHELREMLPTLYNEAWNHPDGKFRERWRIGIETKEPSRG